MPKIKDIYDIINSFAPFSTQCSWDNSGLAVGDPEQEIKKAVFTLDITPEAVRFAESVGAGLIVNHHPVIFSARKAVLCDDPVYMLIKAGIGAVCVHTPLDSAAGGVNDVLARLLGFTPAVPLGESGDEAMIRMCTPSREFTAEELAGLISRKLSAAVRFSDCGRPIKKIALCGGSAADLVPAAAAAGADAFITGDCSHHAFLDAVALGVSVFAAGHYETENPVIATLAALVGSKAGIECAVFDAGSPCKTITL